jgi:uncharacterized membrane protein
MEQSMGARLQRLWRHWTSTPARGRKAFPRQSLAALGAAITQGELAHRGEVRLVVECAMPSEMVWAGVSNRERALAVFAETGVWDTEDNCGVLLYLNLAERKVEIVADRGIARKIDSATWQAICDTMTRGYAGGNFHDSTLAAIGEVNALLQQHFPADGRDNPNELPDQPLMLG